MLCVQFCASALPEVVACKRFFGRMLCYVSAYNRCSVVFFCRRRCGFDIMCEPGKFRVNRLMVAPIVFNITGLLLNDMNR